jgi:hypothetical protein
MSQEETEKIDFWQFGFSRAMLTPSKAPKANRRSVSRLLFKFFDYYANFDFKEMVSMLLKLFCFATHVGKSNLKGRFNTIDLFVLTSVYELLFELEIFLPFFTKQAVSMLRSTALSLPPFRG